MNCFEFFRDFSSVAADKYHSMVLSTQILPNYYTQASFYLIRHCLN